jgi:iron-sulfur cluster assembly protein
VNVINIDSSLLDITPKAREHIIENMLAEPDGLSAIVGIRIGIKGGGCSGLSYNMNWMKKEDIKSNDMIIKLGDSFGAYLDAKCIFYLAGVTLDYEEGLNGKGFKFHNPHATNTCGCGESFSL